MKTIPRFLRTSLCLALSALSTLSAANGAVVGSLTLDPTDDGSIYSSGTVSRDGYITAGGSLRGAVKYSLQSLNTGAAIGSAILRTNAYGFPVNDPTLDTFGLLSDDALLQSTEYSGGTSLGVFTLIANPAVNQFFDFDVTDFLRDAQSSGTAFVTFRMEADSTVVLSSLEYNYGTPTQLIVTTVPEPATAFLATLTALAFLPRRRRNAAA